MNYKMGWKGSAAFQAFTPGGRELVFDLADGLAFPSGNRRDVPRCTKAYE
jgi:hypothetical protein